MAKKMKTQKIDGGVRQLLGIDLKENGTQQLQRYFFMYRARLTAIALSAFDWKNKPDEVDSSILENILMMYGKCAFFYDEVMEKYFTLPVMQINKFDLYGRPLEFVAKSIYNNISFTLNQSNAVIIFDTPCLYYQIFDVIDFYAAELSRVRLTMDSNMDNMKTPWILKTKNKNTLLSIENLFKKIDSFERHVVLQDDLLDEKGIDVLTLGTPDYLETTRAEFNELWNEALTAIGIPNISGTKRERMIVDEVRRSIGGAVASQYTRLQPRMDAVELIDKMFGLNIEVDYREGILDERAKGGMENEPVYDGASEYSKDEERQGNNE